MRRWDQPAAETSLSSSMTSAGRGRRGLTPSVPPSLVGSLPYRISSSAASLSALTLVESMMTQAVGLKPGTSTGVVVTSQLKVMASGESLTVW